jgi:hypothetical protein
MSEIWKSFDERLFVLKLAEPVRQMHEKVESRRRKVQFERRKISQGEGVGLFHAFVDSDLDVLFEFLEKDIDRICREVWRTQGNSITAEFVRVILVITVFNAFEARTGAIKWGIEEMANRQNLSVHLHPVRDHLARAIIHLKEKLSNRYEAEARELEYKNASSTEAIAGAAGQISQEIADVMPSEADLWRDVHDKFKLLTNEQRGMAEDEWLCVYRDRNPRETGPFILPEMGPWKISKGPNHLFRKKFKALANRAGTMLGPRPGSSQDYFGSPDPPAFWVECLYDYMLENASPLLFAPAQGRETMKNVCESSATYCASLEKKTLITSAFALEGDAKRGTRGKHPESAKTESSDAFICSPDYRSVKFRDVSLSFTSRQAQVIEMLHEAHNKGAPELGKDYILEQLGERSSRLRDTFKKHEAWNFLIVGGKKRGTYRLDLPDPHPQR